MRTYDYLVIGGGLTGLLIARKLSAAGADVAIAESELSLGGSNRPALLAKNKIENGLRFLPKNDLLIKGSPNSDSSCDKALINKSSI